MKYLLLFLLAFVSFASARTPIDTVAWERSDSGSKYIKIHAELPREQTLYSRYTPTNMDSGVAIELLDSASFTRWGVANKISWTVTPSNKARLLGVRGAIQR